MQFRAIHGLFALPLYLLSNCANSRNPAGQVSCLWEPCLTASPCVDRWCTSPPPSRSWCCSCSSSAASRFQEQSTASSSTSRPTSASLLSSRLVYLACRDFYSWFLFLPIRDFYSYIRVTSHIFHTYVVTRTHAMHITVANVSFIYPRRCGLTLPFRFSTRWALAGEASSWCPPSTASGTTPSCKISIGQLLFSADIIRTHSTMHVSPCFDYRYHHSAASSTKWTESDSST